MEPEHATQHPAGLCTGRSEALSDGIFAMALTLLIVTFDVLKASGTTSPEAMKALLLKEGPDLLHYAESFILVGAFWVQHHTQFHFIKRCDWRLLWLNLMGLMAIVLIPITNTLVGDYGNYPFAAAIFEANMLLIGAFSYLTWAYATQNHRLVEKSLDDRIIRACKRRNLIIPALSLVSLAICPFFPRASTILFFLAPLLMLVIGRTTCDMIHAQAPAAAGISEHPSRVSGNVLPKNSALAVPPEL
jgi:uncharacterized membrane protein